MAERDLVETIKTILSTHGVNPDGLVQVVSDGSGPVVRVWSQSPEGKPTPHFDYAVDERGDPLLVSGDPRPENFIPPRFLDLVQREIRDHKYAPLETIGADS